jgi:hypothetical protein
LEVHGEAYARGTSDALNVACDVCADKVVEHGAREGRAVCCGWHGGLRGRGAVEAYVAWHRGEGHDDCALEGECAIEGSGEGRGDSRFCGCEENGGRGRGFDNLGDLGGCERQESEKDGGVHFGS